MDIEWSPLAKLDYWQNIEYLETEWSEKEVISFIKNVDETINLLKENNIQFTKTHHHGVLKVVVMKQISLFYKVEDGKIKLLRFWNNYKDLDNFKLR